MKGSVESLALHEGFPGHAMPGSLNVPNFLKYLRFAKTPGLPNPAAYPYSAFAEGWGLYCEYLGYELGMK